MSYKWRVHCITSSKHEYTTSNTKPTQCPVNSAHTITPILTTRISRTHEIVMPLQKTIKLVTVFSLVGTIHFPGTRIYNVNKIRVVGSTTSGTFDIKIFDITNSLTIATVTGINYTTPTLIDMGPGSNLNATDSIWEIQVKNSFVTNETTLNSITLEIMK